MRQALHLNVLERSVHFGPRTSIPSPLKPKRLRFGLLCSCILKNAGSRGRGISQECGKPEIRILGFPCFPYSVVSMACFGNARRTITIAAKAPFGNGVLTPGRLATRGEAPAGARTNSSHFRQVLLSLARIFPYTAKCRHGLFPGLDPSAGIVRAHELFSIATSPRPEHVLNRRSPAGSASFLISFVPRRPLRD